MAVKKTAKAMVVVKNKKVEASAQEDNGNGVASLVLGISSIIIPVLGIVTGILAIIYANKQKKIQPNGMATAGLVTGIVGLVFQAITILIILAIFSFIGMLASSSAAL
jgi:heme/copper-type cytochrome/quinol oxidase subunit 2